jgi:hypothetical protein
VHWPSLPHTSEFEQSPQESPHPSSPQTISVQLPTHPVSSVKHLSQLSPVTMRVQVWLDSWQVSSVHSDPSLHGGVPAIQDPFTKRSIPSQNIPLLQVTYSNIVRASKY